MTANKNNIDGSYVLRREFSNEEGAGGVMTATRTTIEFPETEVITLTEKTAHLRKDRNEELVSLIRSNQISYDTYKKQIYIQLIENEQHLRYIEKTQIGTHCPKLIQCIEDTASPSFKGEPCDSVFFFDIDNCLYKKNLKIDHLMKIYIRKYFQNVLHLPKYQDAKSLNERYYKEYGLAIKGLINEHPEIDIDPIEYNQLVDDALPLQDLIKPDPELRSILLEIKNSKKVDKLWLFTNAYKNHGIRVVKLLGIADIFDGITYCNYNYDKDMVCKPNLKAYEKAMRHSGIKSFTNAYFIDDSTSNIRMADKLNFKKAIVIDEDYDSDETTMEIDKHTYTIIRDFAQLRDITPELFS